MFPSLPLLLVPCAMARRSFSRWVGSIAAVFINASVFCIRFGFGIKTVVHIRGGARGLQELCDKHGDLLIIANHRTTIDWAFIWCLTSGVRRLRGLKIAVMHWFRFIPGVGWAGQCIQYAFMRGGGRNTQGDLHKLQRTVEAHESYTPLTLLVFPEGHDLNERNLAQSNRFADQQDPPLPHYTQVLHPRTAGFSQTWTAFAQRCPTDAMMPPALVDTTIAYVDYVPHEIATPVGMFILGRSPPEVHILIEVVDVPACADAEVLENLCRQLFAKKEERLNKFYDASSQEDRNQRIGNVSALTEGCEEFESAMAVSSVARPLLSLLMCCTWSLVLATVCWFFRQAALYIALYSCCVALIFTFTGCCGGIDGWIQRHEACWPSRSRDCLITAS